MEKKWILLLAIGLLCMVIIGAGLMYTSMQNWRPMAPSAPSTSIPSEDNSSVQSSEPPQKILAADFQVQDAMGNTVSLSNYIGKPIVLNFWASWCPPCKWEMPFFEEVYQEMGDTVQFMMIDAVDNMRETKEAGEKYVTEKGYTFPVFYDVERNASNTYGVYSLPSTLFIDAEGYVVSAHVGAMDKEKLKEEIDKMLTGVQGTGDGKVNPSCCDIEPEYMKITPEQGKKLMAEATDYRFVDVRTEEEYETGYIKGAELITDSILIDKMDELFPDKNQPIFLYCRSGRRSAAVANAMVEKGYIRVFDLGGIIDWPYQEDIVKP